MAPLNCGPIRSSVASRRMRRCVCLGSLESEWIFCVWMRASASSWRAWSWRSLAILERSACLSSYPLLGPLALCYVTRVERQTLLRWEGAHLDPSVSYREYVCTTVSVAAHGPVVLLVDGCPRPRGTSPTCSAPETLQAPALRPFCVAYGAKLDRLCRCISNRGLQQRRRR